MGHLIGDWVLQSDRMAYGKRQTGWNRAGAMHYAIYSVVILGALWLAGIHGRPLAVYLLVGSLIFGCHWLIDGTRLIDRWMPLCGQGPNGMLRLVVDQTFHLVVLAVTVALS